MDDDPRDQTDPPGQLVGIQAASQLLGLPSPTIRSWERRYALPTGRRSPGGHRRYSAEDIALLRRMHTEIEAGRTAAEAASLVTAAATAPPAVLRDAFLQAAHRFNGDRINEVLDQARQTLGLDRAVEEVLLAAMRRLGDQWATGRCDVAHEHLATAAVQTWLGTARQAAPAPTRSGTVVLCCGPRDWHTLGLEAFALLLRARGVNGRLLGARTPVDSLRLAAEQPGVVATVVASHLASARSAAVEAIRMADDRAPDVYYAGAAFRSPRTRTNVPGRYLGEHLAKAADRLVRHL
ncbi:MAG: MerR family transcriptional regulator [Actinomycetes bacterium]